MYSYLYQNQGQKEYSENGWIYGAKKGRKKFIHKKDIHYQVVNE